MTVFYTWPFPASKGSYAGTDTRVSRTLSVRLSEIVNVKDWGAVGDINSADGPKIQAAIDFCISQGGGKVFIPAGAYTCASGLVVGSDDINKQYNYVQLIGCGGGTNGNTVILGPGAGWGISKGSKTYDLIQRVEGMRVTGLGAIKITGHGVQIRNCAFDGSLVMVDASQATGATIMDSAATSGGDGPDSTAAGPKVFSSTGVGFYLGNNCMAVNCRLMGSNWITYALSGTGASVVGCSTETTYTAVRLGWAPDSDPAVIGGGRELAAVGCTVTGLQTERQTVTVDLFNAVGCYVAGNAITGGQGTTVDQPITDMVYSGGTITATTIAAHNLPVGTSKLLLNVVLEATIPTPWRPDVFTTCTNATSNTFTYTAADPGYLFKGTISAMSWDPVTHVVTVTSSSTGANPLPVGLTVKLDNIGGAWNPGAGNVPPVTTVPFNVKVTSTTSNTTHFTYAGPTVDPGAADQVGNWDRSPGVGWGYPGLYGIRCRKVRETLIIANQTTTNSSLGIVDLEYGAVPQPYNQTTAGEAIHANNMIVGLLGDRGWIRPTAENAAGWKFVNCGIAGLLTGSNPSAFASPGGSLTFAYLPGQFTNTDNQWQGGPFEGQEYDISDGSKSGFTPPTAAAFDDTVIGGGNGKYKVRYNGSVWKRIG